MKFSICIPQFNRIEFLKQALAILENQSHSNFEVIISDDCSTDNTQEVINEIKSTFDRFNSDRFDKSIYTQIALALNMICNDAVLFSIDETWVRKDITISNFGEAVKSNSYRDFINRKWSAITAADGGLKSVINVLCTVLESNNLLTNTRLIYIG